MAKQRYAQFYRNTTISTFASIQLGVQETVAAMQSKAQDLKDGEIILGRYGYPGKSQGSYEYGVIVGISRYNASANSMELDFLYDLEAIQLFANYEAQRVVDGITSTNTLTSVSVDGKTYTLGSQITQTSGVNSVTGSYDLVFASAPSSANKIVTQAELTGIVGGIYYKGTVSNNGELPTTSTEGVQAGWVYVVDTNGTYDGKDCEVGDMIIVSSVTENSVDFNIVSGENQYELGYNPTISVGGGQTIIGTFEGHALSIAVTDDYHTLVGTADADDVQNPTSANGRINVLNRVEESDGVISAVTAYTLSTVASTGAAGDVSVVTGTITSNNVQDALEELAGKISNSVTTINSMSGNFTVDTQTMQTVDASHHTLGVLLNPTGYVVTTANGLDITNVDNDGTSTVGTALATVTSVNSRITDAIGALDVGTTKQGDITTNSNSTSSLVIYGEAENDGKIAIDSASSLTELVMAGVYHKETNRVALESNVEALKLEIEGVINGLDNVVDAASISTSLTPTGQFDVLTAVEQINGKIAIGTKVTLATVAHSGAAADVSIADSGNHFASDNVEGALEELYSRIGSVSSSRVDAKNGVTISSMTTDGVTISTVELNLAEKAHAIGSTEYNANADSILLIGSDGKLTIEDTWDCGTY